MKTAILLGVVLALAGAGCKKSSSTTSPTTTTAPASPTVTETFTGTLQVGGTASYNFTVSQYGTVNLTLTSMSGVGVPSTVAVNLAIGVPGDSGCSAGTSLLVRSGTAVQVTADEYAGTYCAAITDVGNLNAPARFSVTVAYP